MTSDSTVKNCAHEVCYACKYAPIELMAGFGAQTKVISAEADSFEAAERLAHANLCGYGKSLLAAALSSDVHELVLTSCCDVMRRVYDVLQNQEALDFLWLIDLPHKSGSAERQRLAAQLRELAQAYASYLGQSFDVGRALAALIKPSEPQDHAVVLLGAHAGTSLIRELEENLGHPLSNRSCTGERSLPEPPVALSRPKPGGCSDGCRTCTDAATVEKDSLEAFLDWYAGALLGQTPCMRMLDAGGRSRLTEGKHPGVVYHTMKFCDYYGFEYAQMAAGSGTGETVPLLKVETDGTSASAGQLCTRIEAFDETLRARDDLQAQQGRQAMSHGAGYVLGIDSGSTSTDAVIVDAQGQVVASVIMPTGAKASLAAEHAIDEVLERAQLSREDLGLSVSTGYGRNAIARMDRAITEITCHARGAHALCPEALTIIDIGGQDSKVIHLAPGGKVANFVMNDKCAAGTGRFLETMARALEMSLDNFCQAGLEWKKDVTISSMCTVFAESEVVSLVADDTPTPDVIHGLDKAVARKTAALAKRVGGEPPYLMTGGVANNQGVVKALEDALGAPVATHEDSQLCGAIGAALIGLESLKS